MSAFYRLKLTLIIALAGASAFSQTNQSTATPPTDQPPSGQATTSQPPNAPPPAKPQPASPHSVADAARASKQLQESAPPAKVYRNKDVKSPAAAGGTPTANSVPPTAPAADEQTRKDRAFEAQGRIFKSQMLVEKGKVVDIQNHMRSLKEQFDAWSMAYAQDPTDAQQCWTSTYYTPYYKDWCDAGRDLKTQYDAAQRQLDQERIRLEQMQENIRRQGYGNAIYDPD
jgi:hypothetical protein